MRVLCPALSCRVEEVLKLEHLQYCTVLRNVVVLHSVPPTCAIYSLWCFLFSLDLLVPFSQHSLSVTVFPWMYWLRSTETLPVVQSQLDEETKEQQECVKQGYANQPFIVGHQLLVRWISSLQVAELSAAKSYPIVLVQKQAPRRVLYCLLDFPFLATEPCPCFFLTLVLYFLWSQVPFKKQKITWVKMLFWIPIQMWQDHDQLGALISQLEHETKLEAVGCVGSDLDEPDAIATHPVIEWLHQHGRTPHFLHLPTTLGEISDTRPALYDWDADTGLFHMLDMFLGFA